LVRRDLAPERHVEVLRRPVRLGTVDAPQFDIIDAETGAETLGFGDQRHGRGGVDGGDPAVHAERYRDQRVPEEQALQTDERQYPPQRAAVDRLEIESLVAERRLDDTLPP